VIEWAKDDAEAAGSHLPRFERDTASIYLVTSRDGVHINAEWVYARQPLVPKGALQHEWNSGFQLAASQIVMDDTKTYSRVYYEARKHRHEDRFKEAGSIGMASWRRDTIVGVRAANATVGPAVLVTKAFSMQSDRLGVLVNVDAQSGPCGNGSVAVEVVDDAERTLPQASDHLPIPITTQATAARVQWTQSAAARAGAAVSSIPISRGSPMRLRITIAGSARLYAFRLIAVASGPKPPGQRFGRG